MPNHVRNIIHFDTSVPESAFWCLLAKVTSNDSEDRPRFDFNALIPMPKALNIESGSRTDEGLVLYNACAKISKLLDSQVPALLSDSTTEGSLCESTLSDLQTKGFEANAIINAMKRVGLDIGSPSAIQEFVKTEEGKKMYDLGKAAAENLKVYGAPTWYDWCWDNWGTKWNAYDCDIDPRARTISFSTAWDAPAPVAAALAKAFPQIGFQWLYADEDCGSNAGRFVLNNEEDFIAYTFDSFSDKAYNAYVACWGANRCLYQKPDGNWAHYDCEACPHPC